MRFQDDFMKWQNQLLQNQQILHNRVVPTAANPLTMNNVGKTQGGGEPRRPIEITIPIRMEEEDEDIVDNRQTQLQCREPIPGPQFPQANNHIHPGITPWRNAPTFQVGPWQERPTNIQKMQPEMPERSSSQSDSPQVFGQQPAMQTIYHTTPQGRQQPSSNIVYQQVPPQEQAQPQGLQHRPQSQNNQQGPRSGIQVVAQPIIQMIPQQGFQQAPKPSYQQVPQQSFQQGPQQRLQQGPQQSFQPGPQQSFQQGPQQRLQQGPQQSFQQGPPQNFHQVPQSSFQQIPQQNYQQGPQLGYQQIPQPSFQQVPQPRPNSTPQQSYQKVPQPVFQEGPQPNYQQGRHANQQPSQPNSRNYVQPSSNYGSGQVSMNGVGNSLDPERVDDNINARFSSVVTLNKDENGPSAAPSKDKVRSIVQLNNTGDMPTHGPQEEVETRTPVSTPSLGGFSGTPMSSRLVQQAVQQQPNLGRTKVSPPRIERLPSPPKAQRYPSPPKLERQPTPPENEPPNPFAGVKLRPVETRVSPPKMTDPEIPAPPGEFGPPPPPPPPLPAMKVPKPPPPPPMSEEDRRTATGKKIISSINPPQLDAREELMMAIRQFGGAGNLKRGSLPPPGCQFES